MLSKKVVRWLGAATAGLIAVTGLAVTGDSGSAIADTTAADAKAKVQKLTKEYNELRKKSEELSKQASELAQRVDAKIAEVNAQESKVNMTRTKLAQFALADYQQRPGDSSYQALIAEDPGEYLNRLAATEKFQHDNQMQLQEFQAQLAALEYSKRELARDQEQIKKDAENIAQLEEEANKKLKEAQALYDKLSAEERAQAEAAANANNGGSDGASRNTRRNQLVTTGGNTYAWGNCTWYAYEIRKQRGLPVGSNWGNARTWAAGAAAAGLQVDGTPAVNAIMVSGAGWYGHVAIVEQVHADGSFTISEMNWVGFNQISERTISSPAGLRFIH